MPPLTSTPAPAAASAGLPSARVRRQATLTSALVATVIFLTAIAPLATDMYVPAFPRVAGDLSATATQVQLTLTTYFVGR
jgi:DHA1 family bicyclomycin/chloramphenicol resistance-like MFS transporter